MVFHKPSSSGPSWLVFALLVLLGACGSPTVLLTPTPTAHPLRPLAPGNGGGTGRIALACAPDPAQNQADICVSTLDGSGLRRLTSGPGPNVSPAWSPDGQRLVFRAADAQMFEASDIWIMQADGSGQTNLTNDQQSNWGATWAPDGKHILFNSAREGGMPHLYLMNPDGSELRRLCPHSTLWEEYPDWSPDGTQIAFMSNVGFSAWVIYVMQADCSGLRQVTHGPGEDSGPRWSPDGKQIAFTSNRTGQAEVYLMNADGSQQTTNDSLGITCDESEGDLIQWSRLVAGWHQAALLAQPASWGRNLGDECGWLGANEADGCLWLWG